ncbi:MAG TPA: hypothetical protein VMT67_01680 [Terriglobales bacterium]|nr:hypothetical protein [Terriglobales bacterium]
MSEKHNIKLPATVEKIIRPPDPRLPEKAQISIERGADPLYQEIRIENSLKDSRGKEVKLKEGAKVEVTVEASDSGVIQKEA